jgi:WXXGXW repeat (2 copies)
MIKTGFIATAVALASLGAAPQMASAQQFSLQIGTAPPPLRYEVVPAPRRAHAWVPGHWEWRGNQYAWVNGYWIQERPGYAYLQPQWVQVGTQWQYRPGQWNRGGRGDTDHDGIPNRFDRDRDGDGIRNRADRDRDGDGVPNRYDRRPDNPNRR